MPDIGLRISISDDGSLMFDKFADNVIESLDRITRTNEKLAERLTEVDKRLGGVAEAANKIASPFTTLGFVITSLNQGLDLLFRGIGLVTGLMSAGIYTVKSFSDSFVSLGSRIVSTTEQFQKFSLILGAAVGQDRGGILAKITKDIADVSPLLEKDVQAIVQSLSLIPAIQAQLQTFSLDRVRTELKSTVDAIQALSVFRPDQGPQGALYAFREFLQGSTRSLQMRFDLDINSMLELFNSNTRKLKSSVDERRRVFEEMAKAIVPPEVQYQLSSLPSLLYEGIFEQLNNFLIRIGNAGFYKKVSKVLEDMFADVKNALTSDGGPFAEVAEKAGSVMVKILDTTLSRSTGVTHKFLNVLVKDSQKDLGVLDKIGLAIKDILDIIDTKIDPISRKISILADDLAEFITKVDYASIWDFIKNTFEAVKSMSAVILSMLKEAKPALEILRDHPVGGTLGGLGAGALGIAGVSGLTRGILGSVGRVSAYAATQTGVSSLGAIGTTAAMGGAATIAATVFSVLTVLVGGYALGGLINKMWEQSKEDRANSTSSSLAKLDRGIRSGDRLEEGESILSNLQKLQTPEFQMFSKGRSDILDALGTKGIDARSTDALQKYLTLYTKLVARGRLARSNENLASGQLAQAAGSDLESQMGSVDYVMEAQQEARRVALSLNAQRMKFLKPVGGAFNADMLFAPAKKMTMEDQIESVFLNVFDQGKEAILQSLARATKTTEGDEVSPETQAAWDKTASTMYDMYMTLGGRSISEVILKKSSSQLASFANNRGDLISGFEASGALPSGAVGRLVAAQGKASDIYGTAASRTMASKDVTDIYIELLNFSSNKITELMKEFPKGDIQYEALQTEFRQIQDQLEAKKQKLIDDSQNVGKLYNSALEAYLSSIAIMMDSSRAGTQGAFNTAYRRYFQGIESVKEKYGTDGMLDSMQGYGIGMVGVGKAQRELDATRRTKVESPGDALTYANEEYRLEQLRLNIQTRYTGSIVEELNARIKSGVANKQNMRDEIVLRDTLLERVNAQEDIVRLKEEEVEKQKRLVEERTHPLTAFKSGVRDARNELTLDSPFAELGKSATITMRDAFKDGIVDGIRSGGKNGGEIFKQFLGTMESMLYEAAARQLANLAVQGISSMVSNIALSFMPGAGAASMAVSSAPSALPNFYNATGGILPGSFTPFAAGGIVRQPTLGMVGEGGSPEAVIPLSNGRSVPVSITGMPTNQASQKPVVNLTNINTVDKMLIKQIVVENDGEVVMNVIGMNSSKIRRILGFQQ